nr:hypothetical protein [uncultured Undibacterium sp.]
MNKVAIRFAFCQWVACYSVKHNAQHPNSIWHADFFEKQPTLFVNTLLRYLKRLVIWLGSISLFLVLIFSAFSFFIAYPYYQIKVGMSENQVIETFGDNNPLIDRARSAFLCDIKAWYGDCKIIENSGATHFLTFKIFFDTYAIVGFKDNKVIVKGLGDG